MSTAQSESHIGKRLFNERGLSMRSFRLAPKTINEEARTVEAVIATENPVRMVDYDRYEVVDEILLMDGLQAIPDQVPLLDSHSRYSVMKQLGSTRSIRVGTGGDELIGVNHFASDEDGERAWKKVSEGHVRDNSVGYQVHEALYVEPGETSSVSGREFTAGVRVLKICTSWTLQENSLTPIGADPGAKTRSAKETSKMSEKTESKVIELDAEREAREAVARKTRAEAVRAEVMAFTPTNLRAFAENLILDGKNPDECREALRAHAAKTMQPVGTPEAPDIEITDEETQRSDDDAAKRELDAMASTLFSARKEG